MESNLAVIGLNHRSAPVEVRERFWVHENSRSKILERLASLPGIEEAALLTTCNRTEFFLWVQSVPVATDSLFHLLVSAFGLRPCEREYFYVHTGGDALRHVFRVAASLDSMVVGEPEITGQVKSAWALAQHARTTARFLDAVFQKALSVAKRVRNETAIGTLAVSVPYAAVELAKQIFGSLEGRKVLILGAGKMGELSARYLQNSGACRVRVSSRTYEHALQLAETLGGTAIRFDDLRVHLAEADIVISSTGSAEPVLTFEHAREMHHQRRGRPVFLIDIAVPRDIDPAVRGVPGVFLYDIDDLERVLERNLAQRRAAAAEAERLVAREAQAFQGKLAAQRVVPTIVALRERLEEIRRQELTRYRSECGPISPAAEEVLEEFTRELTQRISGLLARELKRILEKPAQEEFTAVVRRLFGLGDPSTSQKATRAPASAALAGNL